MFPRPVPSHDLLTILVHSLLDGFGIAANLALMLCVLSRTPKTLRSFSCIILMQAVADLVGCTTSLLVCVRLIPIRVTLAMVYIGPCAVISSHACHITFALMLCVFTFSLYLIAFAFAYRLFILYRSHQPPIRYVFTCLLVVFLPSFLMLLTYLGSIDEDGLVREAIRRARPTYLLDDYVVNGHLSVLAPRVAVTLAGCTLPWVPLLLLIIVIRRKVQRKITELRRSASARSCEMHITLIKCLTIQAALPLSFLFGSLFFYLSLFDIVYSPMQEHFTMMSVAVMPTVSPLISIRFIKPYRNAITGLRVRHQQITSKTICFEPH